MKREKAEIAKKEAEKVMKTFEPVWMPNLLEFEDNPVEADESEEAKNDNFNKNSNLLELE